MPEREIVSIEDASGDRATTFGTMVDGEVRNVYVDPFEGRITGDLAPTDLISDFAIRVHGDLTAGAVGGIVMELAACWGIVMAITGYYLFFRGRSARLARVARKVRGAATTNWHAWVGALAGAGILFLVVSGLPWTQVWGTTVQSWVAGTGFSLQAEDPGGTSTLRERLEEVDGTSASPGWAIGEGDVPQSATEPATTIGIDTAVAAARAEGIPEPYFIAFPAGETGVFSIMGDQWHDDANPSFSDVTKEAAAHIDQYSGDVVATYGYNDYTAAAQVVSQAIAMHEGRRFGAFSGVITTAFCLGIIFLCVSAPIMWWRRRARQRGSFAERGIGAPKGRMPVAGSIGLVVILTLLSIALPVFGVSLVAILLIDTLLIRRVPALRRFFGTT
jgi:uncharacterized iron-regulated membrane protein